jgi:hypothetical protein
VNQPHLVGSRSFSDKGRQFGNLMVDLSDRRRPRADAYGFADGLRHLPAGAEFDDPFSNARR